MARRVQISDAALPGIQVTVDLDDATAAGDELIGIEIRRPEQGVVGISLEKNEVDAIGQLVVTLITKARKAFQ